MIWGTTCCIQPSALGLAVIALCFHTGCAACYTDSRTGVEHLWGFGQMRLERGPSTNGLATVTSGVRVPGLYIGLGRDNFGLSLGYVDRQRLVVVSENEAASTRSPSANGRWRIGHLCMSAPPSSARHYTIITGRALAGIGAGIGGGDTRAGLGLTSLQRTHVTDENFYIDIDQDTSHWPDYDLFNARVNAMNHQPNNQELP